MRADGVGETGRGEEGMEKGGEEVLNEGAQGGGGEEEEKEKGKGQLSRGSILSCFMSVSQQHLSCPEERQGSERKKISCSWRRSGTNPSARTQQQQQQQL